ncbi:ABC transporter permease [Huintestinicola sp.]|uniref:ABC transporter permease n=1 Tax=Huintestinicola sp. TaxID=2981661 RepID=UPI003D7C84A6
MGAIYKREMKAFFTSPIAYIYLAIFYVISAFYFVGNNIMGATTDMSYAFLGIFMIIMLFIPLLTMRLMSDEKKQKTDQGLLTAPVNLAEIVLGKFFAAATVFLIGMAIYIPYVLVLYSLAGTLPWATVIGNFVGLLLVGTSFISIGLFVSSLTEIQIVAAIISLLINFLLYMIDVFASSVTIAPLKKVMVAVGFYNRYTEFTQGILNITSVVFFISVIFIFNFLTVRVLERRRWS